MFDYDSEKDVMTFSENVRGALGLPVFIPDFSKTDYLRRRDGGVLLSLIHIFRPDSALSTTQKLSGERYREKVIKKYKTKTTFSNKN